MAEADGETRRRWASVAASAVVVLLLLGALEGIARARYGRSHGGTWRTVEEREATFTPYTQAALNPYDPAAIEESPYFGRRPWPTDGRFTVMLGGSTAAGSRASDYEHAYFRRAAATLHQEIVSAGQPGFVSGQEMNALALAVLPHQPARVVLLSGFNDVYHPAAYGTPPGYPHNWLLIRWLLDSPAHGLALWFGMRSALANALVSRDIAASQPPPPTGETAGGGLHPVDFAAVLHAWETDFRAMAALCRGAGIEFVFMAQPNGVSVGATLPPPYDDAAQQNYLRERWPEFVAHAHTVCRDEHVWFVDASGAVPPEAFADPAHFDDPGHAALGELLAETIAALEAPADAPVRSPGGQ